MDSAIDHELFKNQIKEFDNHLKLDGNYRIIFSGRFGIGKTTFLKHFFDMPENKEKYRVIHLFPVNYSVGENADIFEYIKYDIVAHLLSEASKNNITLDETTIPRRLAYPMLLSQRPIDVVAPLLHFFGPVGKVFEGYNKLLKELEEEREEMKNEKKALTDYLKTAQDQLGSPYEQDFYSQLIVELLEQWKETEVKKAGKGKQADEEATMEKTSDEGQTVKEIEKKDDEKKDRTKVETVLVVDDLDRVDPQHIFRLLNVFAAHFDAESDHSHNKFGFDKVIFVCDETNIRSIFRHYYGISTDFNGYLDKFYSKEIYPFRIREDVLQRLPNWVSNFYSYLQPTSEKENTIKLTRYILRIMIMSDAINMRTLSKLWSNSKYPDIRFKPGSRTNEMDQFILSSINTTKSLIGNKDDFLIAISACITYANNRLISEDELNKDFELLLLPFLPRTLYLNEDNKPDGFVYSNREHDFSAYYQVESDKAINPKYKGNSNLHPSAYQFIFLKDTVTQINEQAITF
jgi:hypothetical protein